MSTTLLPGDVLAGRELSRLDGLGAHRIGSPGTGRSQVVVVIRCPECGVPDAPGLDAMSEPDTRSGGMRLGDG